MFGESSREEIEFIADIVTDDPDIINEAYDDEEEEYVEKKMKRQTSEKDRLSQDEKQKINDADVGTVENGIELTDKGMHWSQDGWWYFPRGVPYSEGEGGGLKGVYWYKKHRTESSKADPEGKVEELYIGTEDSDLPFTIPPSFKRHINQVRSEIESEYGQ